MKKIVIIGIIVVLALIISAFAGILPFSITADTNTVAYNWPNNNNIVVNGVKPPELTDETHLVTAWKSGENSVKLTIQGRAKYANCNGIGYTEAYPVKYYYKIYYNDGLGWVNKLDRTNYDRDFIHITYPTSGHTGDSQYFDMSYEACNPVDRYDESGNKIGTITKRGNLGNCGGYTTVLGEALSIEIKDPHVGALKIEFWIENYDARNPLGVGKVIPEIFLKDEVYLLDGTGKLSIVNEKTVYEEEEDITFSVDTGFSGKTQGGDVAEDGWELRVYNNKGINVKTWPIPDDRRNYELSYTIPDGSYDPNGVNTWKAELWNTLFNQYERYFFAIGAGMSEQIPGMPTISFDKDIYEMGDTCYVTVQSEPNSLGRNTIYEFFVKSFYGTSGTDIIYQPNYIVASGNQATFSFRLARGDEYVTVEATAFDAPHNQGGLPSETGRNYVYVKDKNPEPNTFTITVYVRSSDDELLPQATVFTQYKTATTDSNGKALLLGLPQDTYTVEAKKDGYGYGSETVVLDKDMSITIYLSGMNWLALIFAIIFIIAGVILLWILPGLPFKIIALLICIGIAIAIIWLYIIPYL